MAFALWSPVLVFFFAVTVPLQLEVSKLNVYMVTCNGCNGCVTVDVTVDLSSCAYVCARVKQLLDLPAVTTPL
jgi:hypothetical protein